MNPRARVRAMLFVPAAVVILGALAWAFSGVPDFGGYHGFYGTVINHVAQTERHTSNLVASVVFDYRSLDTLGEEFILFASATGVAMLLRASLQMEEQQPRDEVTHEATRAGGMLLVPVLVVLGLWLSAFGYITPGGGFQGGVVLSGAFVMFWVVSSYRDLRTALPMPVVDAIESLGVGSYVMIGLATLAAGGFFLLNVLPLGTTSTLTSTGTIALLNWASALAVAAANIVIFEEFLKHYVGTLPGEAED
jgi:multicomponent Na+:H+ antiporter subunit B